MKAFIRYLYLFILLFAPLAFGTTETWSKLILTTSIFTCAGLFFHDAWRRNRPLLRVPGLAPLLGMLAIMLFQITPLPPHWVKLISPTTHTLFQETAGLTGPVRWMHVTVDVKATVMELIRWTAYLFFYVLSVQLLSRADFLKRVVNLIIGFGGLTALTAVLDHFSAPETIYWFMETFQNSPFGPYANRNHYAGLMVMLFPIAFCMLLYNKPRVSYETLREKITDFFNYRTADIYLLLLLAVLLMGISVFVSLSRGGIVCLSLSLFLLGIFMTIKSSAGRGKGVMVALLSGLIFLSVGWFGWNPIFERFNRIRNQAGEIAESRPAAWQDSLDIIRAYPAAGTGAGTFFHAHKAFRNKTPGQGYFVHAHNDYLEIAATSGIIGLGFFLLFIGAVLGAVKQFGKRHDPYSIYLFLGSITGLAAILIHCTVEFQLQIGANALYFFFICALCVSAANTKMRPSRRKTYLETSAGSRIKPVFGAAAALLFVFGILFQGGTLLGEIHFNNVMAYYDKQQLTGPDYESLRTRSLKAAIYDPLESQNYVVLAETELALKKRDSVFNYLRKAIHLNPMNSRYLQTAAEFYHRTDQPLFTEKFYHAALKYEKSNSQIHSQYGFWLMRKGRFEAGAKEIQTAVSLSPELSRRYIIRLAEMELTYDKLIRALPAMTRPFVDLGTYLVEVDQSDLALRAYRRAYDNLSNEKEFDPSWFARLSGFYLERELVDDAFRTALAGVGHLPNDSSVRYNLGVVYEKMGVIYRAVEEYEQAIVLNPKNVSARKRLEKLQDQS